MAGKIAGCKYKDFRGKRAGAEMKPMTETLIAVQIHLYYTDLIPELISALKNIRHPFDLYVTTDTQEKADQIRQRFDLELVPVTQVKKVQIEACGNQGRDVIPFLNQLRPVYGQYKYFCHLHTKKSKHSDIGDTWRKYLYDSLMGSPAVVDHVLQHLESDDSAGIIYPETFPPIIPFMNWGVNKDITEAFAARIGVEILPFEEDGAEILLFPAGDMFWAKTEAVHQLLGYAFAETEIPPEEGQLDGTIMHAVERLWSYVAKHNGYCTVLMKTDILRDYQQHKTLFQRGKDWFKWHVVNKILPKGSRRREFVKKLLRPFKK